MKPKVLVIVGPTAVGKTDLSIKLAQHFDGEIISGDSMQVYRHLDIGTAKVTPAERQDVPHFLIDERDVQETFTVADFVERASVLITQIGQRQHLPIIVGGTGFYLQALLTGLKLGTPANTAFRTHWQQLAVTNGNQWVWQQLAERDTLAAQKIPAGNVRRVIRALEVYETTGHSIEQQEDHPNRYNALAVGLNTERAQLYNRINQRVDVMMQSGLENEARWLYEQGGPSLQAGHGIGYKEFFPYFNHDITLTTAVESLKQNSRHYAKRQLTWFRHQMAVSWYDLVNQPAELGQIEVQTADWLGSKA
ncbi:MAG TPA: tRNA (adenosine(37)-N6)-dimethylallyltransferase MiaA [Lactobacillus sp.]|nr:tRNA (adenosine(37)-N6)-dimethylallyltransferase MiaA [Lactobacillus sp.]